MILKTRTGEDQRKLSFSSDNLYITIIWRWADTQDNVQEDLLGQAVPGLGHVVGPDHLVVPDLRMTANQSSEWSWLTNHWPIRALYEADWPITDQSELSMKLTDQSLTNQILVWSWLTNHWPGPRGTGTRWSGCPQCCRPPPPRLPRSRLPRCSPAPWPTQSLSWSD